MRRRRASDGTPSVSCGRWRRPGESEGSREAVRGFRTAGACCLGNPFALFPAPSFPIRCAPRPSGAMWRSCPRLRNWGRRLLNWSPGGPATSVGPGPNTLSPSRDYAPPAGEAGQGMYPLWPGPEPGCGGLRAPAMPGGVTEAGLRLRGLHRPRLQIRKQKSRPGQGQAEGTDRTHRVTARDSN